MIDPTTGALVVMSHIEHHAHQGESFKMDDVQAVDTTTQKWMITTPNTNKYAHMLFDVLCTGELLVVVTEGADRVGTTPLTPINRNRVGTPAAATVAVHRDVSGGSTDGAVTIKNIRHGATNQPTNELAELDSQNEYTLKPNTKYIVTATTYAAVVVSLHLNWLEHVNRQWFDRVKE